MAWWWWRLWRRRLERTGRRNANPLLAVEFHRRARLVKLAALVRETTLNLVAFLLGAAAAVDVLWLQDEGLAEWWRVGHRCRAPIFSPDAADTHQSCYVTCTITDPIIHPTTLYPPASPPINVHAPNPPPSPRNEHVKAFENKHRRDTHCKAKPGRQQVEESSMHVIDPKLHDEGQYDAGSAMQAVFARACAALWIRDRAKVDKHAEGAGLKHQHGAKKVDEVESVIDRTRFREDRTRHHQTRRIDVPKRSRRCDAYHRRQLVWQWLARLLLDEAVQLLSYHAVKLLNRRFAVVLVRAVP